MSELGVILVVASITVPYASFLPNTGLYYHMFLFSCTGLLLKCLKRAQQKCFSGDPIQCHALATQRAHNDVLSRERLTPTLGSTADGSESQARVDLKAQARTKQLSFPNAVEQKWQPAVHR